MKLNANLNGKQTCKQHIDILAAAAAAVVVIVLRRAGHPVRLAVLPARFDVGDTVFIALLDVHLARGGRVRAHLPRNRSSRNIAGSAKRTSFAGQIKRAVMAASCEKGARCREREGARAGEI